MIVYSATRKQFTEDVFSNAIETKILAAFRLRLGHGTSKNEIASWKNSMQYMNNALVSGNIPDDAGVAIEYKVPLTAKRVDFILSGSDESRNDVAVIVELKQWSDAKATTKDAIVETFVGGAVREVTHPSYQAWTYAALIRDFNETVQKDKIGLYPCAYLHNCESPEALLSDFYSTHTDKAPTFLKSDTEKLKDFLSKYVRYGDTSNIMYRIDHGKLKPSKNLADHLASLLQGNKVFEMIDDQKIVYETALEMANGIQDNRKQVYIVEGGPGTGKSVVAINLLVELTNRGLVSQYVTRNAAPRAVYEIELTGSFTKSHITSLFQGSGAYMNAGMNDLDILIVDEAHRLNEKSGFYGNQGENQIKEIIQASRASVFFIDEDQRVTLKDIGEVGEIRRWAEKAGASVKQGKLQSQFRCNGSDGYLEWVNNVLQIAETANISLEGIDFDLQVCASPSEMRDLIFKKNKVANKARLVAGYCWPWKGKNDKAIKDIKIPEHGFEMRWNLGSQGSLWIVDPESVSEIGCIHTCQGLELDYVGVIIGNDFVIRDGVAITDATKRASQDRSVFGYKKMLREQPERAKEMADRVIKNTYRTLMTRGQKGCYVFCVDAETQEYFEQHEMLMGDEAKLTLSRRAADERGDYEVDK